MSSKVMQSDVFGITRIQSANSIAVCGMKTSDSLAVAARFEVLQIGWGRARF